MRAAKSGLKQHAPIKFGEPFNPNSVEGVQRRRRQAQDARRFREFEAEREWRGQQLAKPAPPSGIWDAIRRLGAAPEPSSFALLGPGLLGIAGIMKRHFA